MKKVLLSLLIGSFLTACQTAPNNTLESVTAVTTSTGWGQKVTSAELTYSKPVKSAEISNYQVQDRTITSVQHKGNIVTLNLSADDATAPVTASAGKGIPSEEQNRVLTVKQTAPISATVNSSKTVNKIADDFIQAEFKDPSSGIVVKYNLYVPKNYDPKKSYPLVMFIHDAGATNSNVKNALWQGNGATVWADPDFQAKHPAFVLAPQFDHKIVNDNSDDPEDLDPTINLIKSLQEKYNIDNKRLYTTGQSGGAMMSIAMNIKYPDFFAGSYFVAGQWAAEKTPPMAKNKMLIVISKDDPKAFPGQNAITETLAKHGAVVQKAELTDGSDTKKMSQELEQLLQKQGNVYYAIIASGTLPDQRKDPNSTNKGQAHVGTWKVAYDIDSAKEWLFKQQKQ